MTEFKKGDRVKVTDVLEATITDVHSDGTLITKYGDWIPSDPANISEGWQRTIEKLPDPEPEWVNGDVVKVGGWKAGYWYDGKWYNADRKLHIFSGAGGSAITLSDYWVRGEVEILWKADA